MDNQSGNNMFFDEEELEAMSKLKVPYCSTCGSRMRRMPDGTYLCTNCGKEESDTYEKIKTYLEENPDATIEDIAEEMGIDEETITKLSEQIHLEAEEQKKLDEGSKKLVKELRCRSCGQPIVKGHFCSDCAIRYLDEIKALLDESAKEEKKKSEPSGMSGKMRFINRKK